MTDPTNAYPTFRFHYSNPEALVGRYIQDNISAGAGIDITNDGPASITVAATAALGAQFVAQTTDAVTTSAVDTPLTGIAIAPGAGNYYIAFSGAFQITDDSEEVSVSIYVDGVLIPVSVSSVAAKKNLKTYIGTMAYVPSVLDGQTIDIRWRVTGGTEATFHTRRMIANRVS